MFWKILHSITTIFRKQCDKCLILKFYFSNYFNTLITVITHTKAIVFRSVDYRESSKIVTIFTKEHGKIAVIVHGAKKPKNKFSGLISPGNLLDVVYYFKPTRSVQTLSKAALIASLQSRNIDIKRFALVYSVLELSGQILHENEVNDPVFELLENFLIWIQKQEEIVPSLFCYVQLRLMTVTGIGITFEDSKQTIDSTLFLNVEAGNVSTFSHGSLSLKLTHAQTEFLKLALHSKTSHIFSLDLSKNELKQLIQHLDVYFKYHVDGYKERKSDSIFEQMF